MAGVSSLSLNILVPAIPGLAAKFAADPASVQLAVSLYLMGLAASQLVFGPLSDRFGRRPVVLAGLALATIASTAAIVAASIASLVSARIAQSLGASTGQTIGRAIIRDLYDREHAASMIGLVTSVVVLMPMVAPLIGGILDTLFGWEAIFVFAAIVSFTVFAWAALALPETRKLSPASGQRHFRADLAALAASPRFFGYALCAGLGSAPFFSFLGAAPHVVVTLLGRTSAEYGLWFFVPSIGFMAGNFAGVAADRALRHRRFDLVGDRVHHHRLLAQRVGLSGVAGVGDGHDFPAPNRHRLRQWPAAADVDRRRRKHPPAGCRHRFRYDRLHPDGDRRRRRPARGKRDRACTGRDADAAAHADVRDRDGDRRLDARAALIVRVGAPSARP